MMFLRHSSPGRSVPTDLWLVAQVEAGHVAVGQLKLHAYQNTLCFDINLFAQDLCVEHDAM